MSLIKSHSFLASLMILVALFGVVAIGDSLVSEYNRDYNKITEVTPNIFEQCEPSNPQDSYQTGSETVTLTKPRVQNFICGVSGHCGIGRKLKISMGPVAAPVPRLFGSPSSSSSPSLPQWADSPVNNGPNIR
ncbi:unnamed protein product [Eruca vesicaria subsp. sativa]|uniref:Phytocyanin domain-containing protein n=1 Tax=Eruca vesicaria subsp. sativa TaxID=29727 RepID=A0ABC8IMC2_ERUVS|nr:unnamed protein product [Eruca vesicaria subsp. sativa]